MQRLFTALCVLALLGAAVFWWITAPEKVAPEVLAGIAPDPIAGERIFNAAGCASCHSAKDATGDEKLKLGGGKRFPSDFGTFVAPNISPHPEEGIGAWSDLEIVTAVMKGVSPEGRHYFPAFPYVAYSKAEIGDIASLVAYLRTLPPVATPSQPHEVSFPFNIRRSLGGWKFLFASDDWVVESGSESDLSESALKGRYLVEALGHCGECHTPRNLLGGLQTGRWLEGAPVPGTEKDRTPSLRAPKQDWSAEDIAIYLESGFTPEFDTAGGEMVSVIEETAKLPPEDRAAIAAYLKALPATE